MRQIRDINKINNAIKLFEQGKYKEVFEIAQKLIVSNKNNIDVLSLLIESARGLSDVKNEEKYLLKVIKISDNPVFYHALAVLYYKRADLSNAKLYYKKAIELSPDYIDCYLYLSLIYVVEYNFKKAEELILQAIKLTENTEKVFDCYHYLARLYAQTKEYEKAYEIYRVLVDLGKYDANLLFNFSILCLKLRKYIDGFNLYRARYQEGKKDRFHLLGNLKVLEKNTDVANKKILVLGEQGYGDSIDFIRYIPMLIEKEAKVYASVSSLLVELFQKNYPEVEFVNTVVTKFDYQLPLSDAAYFFSTEYDTIPFQDSYLSVDKKESLVIKEKYFKDSKKKRIGIVWRSNISDSSDNEINLKSRTRDKWNIDLKYFVKYFKQKDIELYSLQVGVTDKERKLLQENNIPSLGDNFVSFYDNALVIDNLDVVIAINTASALLSGAMGKKTIILLPDDFDWRWGIEDSASNWYKSVTLVRQKNREGWESLIKRTLIFNDLTKL